MSGGYIKLHRGWQDSEQFKNEPYCERAAWLWLISCAAWKETTRVCGKGDEVVLKPGQIHTSDRSLAAAWSWDKKRVRRFLAKLERSKSATTMRTTSGTVLTIENWEKYQSQGPTAGPSEGPTEDRPRTTHKERKERKEENNYAFAGRVIRLTFEDLQRWKRAYSDLDLMPLLTARDDWLAGQPEADRKRWFPSTSSYLAKQQQLAFERKPPAQPVIGI